MSAAPLRIALLAPIGNSLYSRLVAHLVVAEPGLELVQIVVRTPWNLSRIRSEFRRDGTRLISKVRLKLLVGEDREAPSVSAPQSIDTIASLAREVRLTATNLNELAAPRKIPYSTVPDHNNPAALKALRAAAPDVVAFTGGGMVRKELLSIPRLGVVNCHCGLLPWYRGMDVVEWPAAEGRIDHPGIGLTLHFMDEGLDTGPVLLWRKMALRPGDDFESIRERMAPELIRMMMKGLRGLRDEAVEPMPQALAAGRQYFVMHPRILAFAAAQIGKAIAAQSNLRQIS